MDWQIGDFVQARRVYLPARTDWADVRGGRVMKETPAILIHRVVEGQIKRIFKPKKIDGETVLTASVAGESVVLDDAILVGRQQELFPDERVDHAPSVYGSDGGIA